MLVTVGVSGLLVHDDRLLVVQKEDAAGVIYTFPGGRQEPGETLAAAISREVWEETGLRVEVGELLWVRDYIGRNHEYAATDADIHVLDHLFRCSLAVLDQPLRPALPDRDQAGVEWVPVDLLPTYDLFFPHSLIPAIVDFARGRARSIPVYLGDAN